MIDFNTKNIKRIVIKIGSNILTDEKGMRAVFFRDLANEILFLKKKKIEVVLVSSGAIASAMSFLNKKIKPSTIPQKQAFAAIGQPILMNHYAKSFHKKKIQLAQILLTREEIEHGERSLNAKHALAELLAMGVVPIVNENDTVTVDEIKIGDNDQLSAHVANLVEADLLVILSHVDGLFDGNPKTNKQASLIEVVRKINEKIYSYVFESDNQRSVGGMTTKLKAAQICLDTGIPLLLTSGFQKSFIAKIFDGTIRGTFFTGGAGLV